MCLSNPDTFLSAVMLPGGMAIDTQLQRTVGTVYGEIMRDSGVSLPNGKYVSEKSFASSLSHNGVRIDTRQVKMALLEGLVYGTHDDILTGIQLYNGGFTFNPWREIAGDPTGEIQLNFSKREERNPRAMVKTMKEIYSLFNRLPAALQEEFLQLLQNYPCYVDGSTGNPLANLMDPELHGLYRALPELYSRMRSHAPKKRIDDFNLALQLMAVHNICADKGNIVREQIESLLSHDEKMVPTSWEQGHLDDAVIATHRGELNRMLAARKGMTLPR